MVGSTLGWSQNMLQGADYIDLTDGVESEAPRLFSGDAWTGLDLDPESCVVRLDDATHEEINRIAAEMRMLPLPLLLRTPDQFDMPRLCGVMQEVNKLLIDGPGIGVVDALPLETLEQDEAVALFWVLGYFVGPLVAQTWDGTMMYDVTDTGKTFSYGVRASRTRSTLVFHTDNASGRALPDMVGLICLRQAAEGGESRFCNLGTIHNRLLEEYPKALERLYRPLYYDRQAEHAEGQPKVSCGPMFSWEGDRLCVRANVDLVRKGYDVAGVDIDVETKSALEALIRVTADPSLWVELPLCRGQLQFLNNRRIAHYRGEYQDSPDPTLKRHLVRTWHRRTGQPTFDG